MKRSILIAALLLLTIAPAASAQQRGFLPHCDETRYVTSTGTDVSAQEYTTDMGQVNKVYTTNECGLEDFVQLFINLADWGLTIIAIVTVFFFAWGAWDWIIAAGRSEMISNGKRKMAGAITGLGLILFAWVIVGLVVGSVTGNVEGYVFPGSSSQRLWFGSKSSCKNTYTLQCEAGTATTIKNGCGDPASTEFGTIAQIQKRLGEHQCDVGRSDGCYGPQTAAAVLSFQQSNDLPPTGEVDLATYQKLLTGGFPCGFDPNNVSPRGCCIPRNTNPNANQKCLDDILQTACEGTQHGNPAINYNFKAGDCPSTSCGGNICTYDSSAGSTCK